jgi:hypothetical protein
VKLQHCWPCVGLAQYGTALVQWYVMHSHERRLPGSMMDNEFEVSFELQLISHSCLQNAPPVEGVGAGYLPVPYTGGAKNTQTHTHTHTHTSRKSTQPRVDRHVVSPPTTQPAETNVAVCVNRLTLLSRLHEIGDGDATEMDAHVKVSAFEAWQEAL